MAYNPKNMVSPMKYETLGMNKKKIKHATNICICIYLIPNRIGNHEDYLFRYPTKLLCIRHVKWLSYHLNLFRRFERNLHETVCKSMQINQCL